MDKNKEETLDSMIESLAGDLAPVKCMGAPMWRAVQWAGFAVVYMAVVLWGMGVREDIAARLQDADFLYETFVLSLIAVSAACASVWLCVPDAKGRKWIVVVPFTLTGSLALWLCLHGCWDLLKMMNVHFSLCLCQCLILAALPAFLIVFMSSRGTTTHPYLMASMNVMAGGAFACIGLRFVCDNEALDHTLLYHVLPFVSIGLLIGVFARRIYKW